MKAYRKKLIGLALAAVFSFSPVSVFASSVNITSGLQIGGDEVECTFDSSRILYGEAKPARILLLRYPKWIVSAIWLKPTEKP